MDILTLKEIIELYEYRAVKYFIGKDVKAVLKICVVDIIGEFRYNVYGKCVTETALTMIKQREKYARCTR
jgi:hypothetical protein